MKKLLCLLLSVLMLLSLAACGEDADQGGDKNNNEGGSNNSQKDPAVPTTTVPAEDDTVWVLVQESDMGSSRYTKYIYDENGVLVAGEFYMDGKKTSDLQFVSTPTPSGGKIVEQLSKGLKEEEFSKNEEYEYDAAGRLIRTTDYNYMGDIICIYTFAYNEAGQLTEQACTKDGEEVKKLTFVYNGNKLMEVHYWEPDGSYGHYIYTYDDNGLPIKVDVDTYYMDEQKYTLEFVTEEGSDWWQMKATEDCHYVVGGRKLFYCEEEAEYGKDPHQRYVSIRSWGIFCTGWVPLVSFGCINSSNYFIGSVELYYEPLEVHLAKQAENQ